MAFAFGVQTSLSGTLFLPVIGDLEPKMFSCITSHVPDLFTAKHLVHSKARQTLCASSTINEMKALEKASTRIEMAG